MADKKNDVAVIGAGSWGTALAAHLADKLGPVTLWCREPEVADGINSAHRNPFFLPDVDLPGGLKGEADLAKVAANHRILVMVIPTQFTRAALQEIKTHIDDDTVFVSASKGIEVETLSMVSEMYAEVFGPEEADRRACYLSGPSFAREVLNALPTAVTVAGKNEALVKKVQELFHTPAFRTYAAADVVGVELGGALKNVIALAAGISDGLGFGYDARAALITRGLAEMMRLGVAMGGEAATFSGLSGLGDLVLTATSDLSRNRTVGRRLGEGERLEEILAGSREVPEGVKTTVSAYQLAQREGVEMPITHMVFEILNEGRDPKSAVSELMTRALKAE